MVVYDIQFLNQKRHHLTKEGIHWEHLTNFLDIQNLKLTLHIKVMGSVFYNLVARKLTVENLSAVFLLIHKF